VVNEVLINRLIYEIIYEMNYKIQKSRYEMATF